MRLMLDHNRQRPGFLPPDPPIARFVIVGLGGTGGYVFYHLARLIASLPNHQERFQIVLADGDVTEEKNLVRQNFAREDVGRYKVEALADRYGNAYGLDIPICSRYIETVEALNSLLYDQILAFEPSLTVLVGAVDNNRTRQLLHQAFYETNRRLVYVDSGNDEWTGQVVLGLRTSGNTVLPPVGYYYPDILEDKDSIFPTEESCTERVVSSPQNIATNVLAGTLVFTLFNQLFGGDGITTYGATFNALTVQTRALFLDAVHDGPSYPFVLEEK
ncbi:MAG: ThiF family adenylyltransferase [Bacillota bacterium]